MHIIYTFLNILLNTIFNFTGDWGISIVILTVVIKIILFPLSIKQKISLYENLKLSEKLRELKNKYEKDKEKLEEEVSKFQMQSAKCLLGFLMSFIQLPILITLYTVVMKMPIQIGTAIIPWVSNLKMSDNYFIIPIIYALISICPNLIPTIKYLKLTEQQQVSRVNLLVSGIFGVIITIKAPIAVSIYFITTGLFSLFEEISFRIYIRRKCLN